MSIWILIFSFLAFASACPDGYFLSSPFSCSKCENTCKTCSGPLLTSCITCPSGSFKHQDLPLCIECPSECSTCSSYTSCQSCSYNFYLTKDKECHPCAENCRTCFGPASNQCLSCVSDAVYESQTSSCKKINTGAICKTVQNCKTCESNQKICDSCDNGFYLSSDKTSCLACDKSCTNCYGPKSDMCLDCNTGGWIDAGVCNYDCSKSCEKCFGIEEDNCFSCVNGNILEGNRCVANGCHEFCSQCDYSDDNNQTYVCTACDSGYFISNDTCEECPLNCLSCLSDSQCKDCVPGFYLDSGSCKSCGSGCHFCQLGSQCEVCDEGFFLTSGNCQMCNQECLSCSGPNNTDCLTCRNYSNLVNNQCVSNSTAGDYERLSFKGMQLIIGFISSSCGLACLITVVYKLCKKDPFYQEVEKEIKMEEKRRNSLKMNNFESNNHIITLQSNRQIAHEENQGNSNNDPQPNYAGLTIVINNKVANFKKTKESKNDAEKSQEEKKEEEKNQLETINESVDEEKSSILVRK